MSIGILIGGFTIFFGVVFDNTEMIVYGGWIIAISIIIGLGGSMSTDIKEDFLRRKKIK